MEQQMRRTHVGFQYMGIQRKDFRKMNLFVDDFGCQRIIIKESERTTEPSEPTDG